MASPISTPKGGGAVSGLGEKFSPDLFTGTGNFNVPIALPPGRNGFQPELGLQYSSGSGNSPFGLGWNLSVPGVMRKTAKGVPKYDDEKDTFILSGAEDLIAIKRMSIRFIVNGNNTATNNEAGIIPLQNESGVITQFRPRTEGLFARIYHLKTNLRNCWKVMSKNGLTSWYGSKDLLEGDLSVVQNPDYTTSIFAWKLTRTEDTFDNHILYIYEKENIRENDYHKWDQNYLSQIKYADYSLTPFGGQGIAYMVRVLFTYEKRTDAFSDFKAGIEVRTTQRCKNIQIFTNPFEGEIKTRTYHFQYSDEVLPVDELPYNGVSLLCKVKVEGHDGTTSESLPPLEFRYTHFKPKQQKFKKLEGAQMPLSSLANPGFELIDLFGNGLQDIVQINGVVRYWRNLGNGKFDAPRIMKDAPSGFNLGDPDVQLVDANGDGRTDLLVNGTNMSGYFSMKHDASWDTKAFKKYKQAPTFSFADPEVKLLDMTGDGITDVLRNGANFECFFHDKNDGWTETKRVPKKQIEDFPNVSFADPRIKLADMNGDGLQDIVQVYSGSIKYWGNKGYGNFAKPVVMKNAPRFQFPFDPSRIQLADIDGDGLADLIYVDAQKITFWINQSGNGWSEPFEISGTPFVTNIGGVRIADIYGSGVSGVLYSFDATMSTQQHRWFFLDLTGGTKPYLLHEMDNNMGALTRISYLPSTRYYLKDQYGLSEEVLEPAPPVLGNSTAPTIPTPADIWKPNFQKRKPWKTTLPFPVQVVSKVEIIDKLSLGKLVTRYFYRHGYWDGGEREFRGFGRVDQKDTETFDRYNTPIAPPSFRINPTFNSSFVSNNGDELQFNGIQLEHYSPPIETRNWFHLGPVGDEFGDWIEIDFSEEYWSEDPNVLKQDVDTFRLLQSLPRRAKRDAFRAWRGSSLRSELYALDANYFNESDNRPYTVSESGYGLRLETFPEQSVNGDADWFTEPVLIVPKETSGYVFFSFATGSRTSQWERGNDPMTQFSFTTDYDVYGQPRKQLSAALPRGILPPYETGLGTSPVEEGNKILSTCSVTIYAQKDIEETFIVDRTCKAISYEIVPNGTEDVFTLKKRVLEATLPTEAGNTIYPIIGFSINYYADETAFGVGLVFGDVGKHGALARSETLVLTDDIIDDAYQANTPECFKATPDWSDTNGYPADLEGALQNGDFRLGYKRHENSSDPNYSTGWYAESGRTKYDWQVNSNGEGLVLATKDVFNSWAEIEYDDYNLLPEKARQHLTLHPTAGAALETNAEYDYRVMQAKMITDPNGNRTVFNFSPLGLITDTGVIGKAGENEGDITDENPLEYIPTVRLEYDFHSFELQHQPVWIKTIKRTQHASVQLTCDEIISKEYSDGFGRLLQTRTQAEDVIFGDSVFGDSGLPETQGQNGNAIGVERTGNDLNVVVSGWQVYNNKGKVIEKYEPYFDKGFDFDNVPVGAGEKVKIYYNPKGEIVRTVNPDGSEKRVIFGAPHSLATLPTNAYSTQGIAASTWENYNYDENDLAPLAPNGSIVPAAHHYTPGSKIMDALGRIVKTITRLDNNVQLVITKNEYDIQGNLTKVIDPNGQIVFTHTYDLRKQPLKTYHRDSGNKWNLADANGKPVQSSDEKVAIVLTAYDVIARPVYAYAKDNTASSYRHTQVSIYGDSAGLGTPEDDNLKGKLYKHYDEAGLSVVTYYDFKGNVAAKYRQVIKDDELLGIFDSPPIDWQIAPYRTDWNPNGGGFDTHAAGLLDTEQFTTNTDYDALNRVEKITLPDGKEIEPEYNMAGALEKVTHDGNEYVKQIAYNARGNRILLAMGNGVMTRSTYDKKTFRLKRLRSEKYSYAPNTYTYQSGTVKDDKAYFYDLIGNILNVVDKTPNAGVVNNTQQLSRVFTYDAMNRLLTATGREAATNNLNNYLWIDNPSAYDTGTPETIKPDDCVAYNQSYEYDLLGNILQLSHHANGNNYVRNFNYQSGTNKVDEIRSGSNSLLSDFTYDIKGNTIGNNSDRKFLWDNGDRLIAFIRQTGTDQPTVYAQYLYDANGGRAKKIVRNSGGNYEVTVYIDGIFEYQKIKEGSNTHERNYTHVTDNASRIATIREGSDHDDIDDDITYNIEDNLNSSCGRLDINGTWIDKEEYFPFGETAIHSFLKKRYRYCGKQKDGESGLYYYGARYYTAWACKFISVDPLATNYTYLTPYNYCGNNPVGDKDVDGKQSPNTPQSESGGGDNIKCGEPPANPTDDTKVGTEIKVSDVKPDYSNYKPENSAKSKGSKTDAGKSKTDSKKTSDKASKTTKTEVPKTDSKTKTEAKSAEIFTPPPLKGSGTESTDYKNVVLPMKTKAEVEAKNVPATAPPLSDAALALLGLAPQNTNTSQQILNSGRVTFGTLHPSPASGYSRDDNANANDNIADAAGNRQAQTSPYSDVGSTNVNLNQTMLDAMQQLSQTYTFNVSEITGGDHSSNSRHYAGVAFDVTSINGAPVNANNPDYRAFMQAARDLGATEVLGPGSSGHSGHIHIAWPR